MLMKCPRAGLGKDVNLGSSCRGIFTFIWTELVSCPESSMTNGNLVQVKAALEAGIAQVRAIKEEWIKCDQEMDEISEWTKAMHAKVTFHLFGDLFSNAPNVQLYLS